MGGLTGIQGVKGDKGESGTQGSIGPRGNQGPEGNRGIRGSKGDKGDSGIQGNVGARGNRGEKGDEGDKGENGDRGLQGLQGIKGDKGEKGDTTNSNNIENIRLLMRPFDASGEVPPSESYSVSGEVFPKIRTDKNIMSILIRDILITMKAGRKHHKLSLFISLNQSTGTGEKIIKSINILEINGTITGLNNGEQTLRYPINKTITHTLSPTEIHPFFSISLVAHAIGYVNADPNFVGLSSRVMLTVTMH